MQRQLFDPQAPAAGAQVAGWRLEALLAQGGGGQVWTAIDPADPSAAWVVKFAQPGAELALLREWDALLHLPVAQLPEAVWPVPAAGRGLRALVLRRVSGQPAGAFLAGRDAACVGRVLADAARVLAAVHAAGWVHGDLHAGNVLVAGSCQDPRVSLLDLGLADRAGERPNGPGLIATAAPERLQGEFADPRDDLFSLGVGVWLAWTGVHPWPDYPARMPGPGDSPQGLPADTPAELALVLRSLVAARRDHRPASAGQVAARLQDAAAVESSALPARQASALRRAGRRASAWWGDVAQLRHAASPSPAGAGPLMRWSAASGCGRTTALRQAQLDAITAGVPCAWLAAAGDGAALQWSDRRAPWASVGLPSYLGSERADRAVEAARWLCGQLSACADQGLLLVDDTDALPEPLGTAITHWGAAWLPASPWRVLAVGAECGAPLPPWQPAEAQQWLRAAGGGRRWDGAVVAALVGAVGGRRAAAGAVAAQLVQQGAVVARDDVWTLVAASAAAAVDAAAAAVDPRQLPDAQTAPTVAAAAVRLVAGVADQATEEAAQTWEARASLDRATARWLVANLPPPVVAKAWRDLGAADARPAVRGAALLAAHGLGDGELPGAFEFVAYLDQLRAAGAPHAVAQACDQWRDALAPTFARDAHAAATVAAAWLGALSATGASAQADAAVATWPAGLHDHPAVALALAEHHFRGGRYPACRACCEAHLVGPAAADAALWLAFAATWQGDRPAATAAVERVQAALQQALADDPRHAWLTYLQALGAYYAGDVAQAQKCFDALAAEAHGSLRAAALSGQGLVAHRRGDLGDARAHYAAAESLAQAIGDHARALNMAMNVAVADHERGDLGGAWAGYGRVVEAAIAAGNPGVEARARTNRGNLLATLGMDRGAADDLLVALPVWQAAGNAHLVGNVRCQLGEMARRQGDLAAANDHLAAAELALTGAGAATERAEIQLERGYLALAQGDTAQAQGLAETVRAAAVRQGSGELHGRALAMQAAIALDAAPYQVPAAAEVTNALSAARTALDLLPESKVLYRCAVAALQARALVAGGQWSAARAVALDHLALLQRTALTVPAALRPQFDHAAAVRDVRLVLRVIADAAAPVQQAGAAASGRLPLLDAVLNLNRRLGVQRDVGPLLEAVMDAAVALTGAERGFLLIDDGELGAAPEERAARLRVAVARNLDRENLRRPQHKLSHTVAERVFVEGEAVWTTDAQADARFAAQASVHAGSLRSILCVPLHTPQGVLGAIYVDNRFAAGAFTAEHAAQAAALADQAAIAIQTARLVERQRQTASDLERSRAQVEELNAQLQAQLADVSTQLHDARADLHAQRLAIARRSDYSRIIGESPQMHRLFSLMDRVRDHAFPVLVVGESGTGKELVARAIHFTGARAKGPFVAVNCGALPSNLLESELFGHTKGAFTGAVSDRRGLFEAASGGTLLLDEVGEMPLEMQVKLLRVLQTGEVTRVGESGIRKVDTRVLAATHRDLAAMVKTGAFREDLLYRLRVVELQIPPLRSRPTDIAALVDQFITDNRKQRIGDVTDVAPAALARLCQAHWPGNVRQLETLLKSACLFANGTTLELHDIEPLLARERMPAAVPSGERRALADATFDAMPLDDVATQVVVRRVQLHNGNKRKAAETLGIDRGTLYRYLRSAGLDTSRDGGQR